MKKIIIRGILSFLLMTVFSVLLLSADTDGALDEEYPAKTAAPSEVKPKPPEFPKIAAPLSGARNEELPAPRPKIASPAVPAVAPSAASPKASGAKKVEPLFAPAKPSLPPAQSQGAAAIPSLPAAKKNELPVALPKTVSMPLPAAEISPGAAPKADKKKAGAVLEQNEEDIFDIPGKPAKNAGKADDYAARLNNSQVPAESEKSERIVEKAKTLYLSGDIDKADEILDGLLSRDSKNISASALKHKIIRLKARRIEIRNGIASDFYLSAEYFFMRGNIPEALLWIERSYALNPAPGSEKLYKEIEAAKVSVLSGVDRKDKETLDRGIKYFMSERFDEAASIFRGLQRYYPELNDFLSTSIIHSADSKNSLRARAYLNEAMNDMKKARYKRAQEKLMLSLEMDKTYLYARFVLEQVNMELSPPQSVVPFKK